jgi:hypothetical protein
MLDSQISSYCSRNGSLAHLQLELGRRTVKDDLHRIVAERKRQLADIQSEGKGNEL